jgi:glucose/arabinose dehydrogenase
MRPPTTTRAGALIACFALACGGSSLPADKIQLDTLELPPGFSIGVFADGLENARSLARGEKGTIFVGTRRAGNVYAVVDRDGDGRADDKYVLAEGLNMPNGVAFRDGALYLAEVHRVARAGGRLHRSARRTTPRVEVHRLWTRRLALRTGGCALQYL